MTSSTGRWRKELRIPHKPGLPRLFSLFTLPVSYAVACVTLVTKYQQGLPIFGLSQYMKNIKAYFPILEWLPAYRKSMLSGDVTAGLTVGVILIPQGMAYALIAGLPPVYGLYAAIVPQLIYVIMGTSRQLAVGPVAMDSLLVASGISVMAAEGSDAYITFAISLAFFVGALQFFLGAARLGFITNLLSQPVISGFTSGAAIIIAINQFKHLTGIDIDRSNQVHKIAGMLGQQIDEINWPTLAIGAGGIALIFLLKRLSQKIPGPLIVVILGTLLVSLMQLDGSGVAIVREIPGGLPGFQVPNLSWELFVKMLPLSGTIAVIAFIEAFSIAKGIEGKKKDHQVKPNQELLAIGTSNIIGSFFMAYPSTGSFSRSAINYSAGGNTPLAFLISAIVVGLILIFLTPVFYMLPLSILAAIIMVSVFGLIDVKYPARLLRTNWVEFFLLLATFIVTLTVSLVTGIITGVILSILVFLYKAAYPHVAILGRVKNSKEFRNLKRFDELEVWENLLIMRVDAPYAFINIQTIKDRVLKEATERKGAISHVIVDASSVSHIDASAVQGINDLTQALEEMNVTLVFASVIGPVRDALKKNWLLDGIEGRLFLNTDLAVRSLTGEEVELHAAMAEQANV